MMRKQILITLVLSVLSLCVIQQAICSESSENGEDDPEIDADSDEDANADLPDLKIETLHLPEECERKSAKGDMLSVHYKGTLEDGSEFDSSYGRDKPFKFEVGIGRVIRGWDEGLLDMCVGEKRRLTIPPHLGYGDQGAGGGKIPGGATLYFETELVDIEQAPPRVNVFKKIDTNGDSMLSREEVNEYLKEYMGMGGEASDAAPTDEEKEKERENLLKEIFKHEDMDEDGFISHEEFRGPKHDEL